MDTKFNIDYQERIDSYIFCEMNEKEKSSFEDELRTNKELFDQYEFTLNVKKGISDRNKKLQLINECQNKLQIKERDQRRKLYTTISGIAAIAIFGLFLFNHNGNSPLIVMPDFSAIEQSTYRGNPDLQSISNLIIKKEYVSAKNKIDSLEIALDEDINQLVKELPSEENQKQLDYFKELHQNLKDDLMWLRLHALVGNGDNEKALEVLSLIRNSDSKYKESADSIFNSIK